jgi:hypothetical protein
MYGFPLRNRQKQTSIKRKTEHRPGLSTADAPGIPLQDLASLVISFWDVLGKPSYDLWSDRAYGVSLPTGYRSMADSFRDVREIPRAYTALVSIAFIPSFCFSAGKSICGIYFSRRKSLESEFNVQR